MHHQTSLSPKQPHLFLYGLQIELLEHTLLLYLLLYWRLYMPHHLLSSGCLAVEVLDVVLNQLKLLCINQVAISYLLQLLASDLPQIASLFIFRKA